MYCNRIAVSDTHKPKRSYSCTIELKYEFKLEFYINFTNEKTNINLSIHVQHCETKFDEEGRDCNIFNINLCHKEIFLKNNFFNLF